MGYVMDLIDHHFSIPAENKEKALEALKDMNPASGSGFSAGRQFAWVDQEEVLGALTLEEALRAWRYDPHVGDDGSIVAVEFIGEKLGDDDQMLRALAPFVTDESYLTFQGEDGEAWRWVFRGGQLIESQGRLVFDEEG